MKPIYILNGPNLNRLGKREPEIYGKATLADVERYCREAAGAHPVEFRQSNSEAEIIGWIHEAIDSAAGIVINPAAFTFTSLAILDALRSVVDPEIGMNVVELALIKQIILGTDSTEIKMILTTPFCPYAGSMINQVKEQVESVVEHDVKVTLLAERWDPRDAGLMW